MDIVFQPVVLSVRQNITVICICLALKDLIAELENVSKIVGDHFAKQKGVHLDSTNIYLFFEAFDDSSYN